MKLTTSIFLIALVALSTAIPWESQIALANALQVGRNQDPNVWSCAGCDENNKPLHSVVIQEKGKDVKSILSIYQEYTVLAFRYTATIKNVGQDILWAIQTQDQHAPDGCKVQKVMDGMWNTIRADVLKGLQNSAHTGRLIITGISLGGALTCLSYVDIAKSGIFANIEIITFGAPRVGNRKWADWFDTQIRSTRYFIKADPIAFLPRCLTPVCNYKQTGQAYVCNKNTQICTLKASADADNLQGTNADYINALAEAVNDHYSEEDNLDGILDHIFGYKKLYNYEVQD